MIHYRMLFLSKKTFYIAAIAALIFLPFSVILTAMHGQMTILDAAIPLLCMALCGGLIEFYRKENLIHLSGLLGVALQLEFIRYLYLTEETLQLGVEGILSQGLYFSMLFTSYILVAFVILVITFNHFTLQIGRASIMTKMTVNQVSVFVLFLCFLSMFAERLMVGGPILLQLAEGLSFLADLCIFVMINCCDMVLVLDGQELFSRNRRKGRLNMSIKKNVRYALIHLAGIFICIFCLTMIFLLGGIPHFANIGVYIMTVVHGIGLFWCLSEESASRNRFLRLFLLLIRISVLATLCLAAYLYVMFLSEFHRDIKPDAVGHISELDMGAVENAENSYVFKTENLYIIFPQYQKIASVFGEDYPSMEDERITYYATSAFFSRTDTHFSHDIVVGAHAQDGVYYEGTKEDHLSAFTFYNGQAHFVLEDPDAAIKLAEEHGGDGFEQLMAIWDGKDEGIRLGKLRCFRVLTEINGRVCVIESAVPTTYRSFIQSVIDIGIEKALYMDMGGKSTYSKYRNNEGKAISLFSVPSSINHQWVVFYK